MIANAIAALGILSLGVIIGVFVAALGKVAAASDALHDAYWRGRRDGADKARTDIIANDTATTGSEVKHDDPRWAA